MRKTVEFVYGPSDRVRVHDDARSVFAGQKGVVVEARQTAEHHLYKVIFGNGADDLLRSYHLEPDMSDRPLRVGDTVRILNAHMRADVGIIEAIEPAQYGQRTVNVSYPASAPGTRTSNWFELKELTLLSSVIPAPAFRVGDTVRILRTRMAPDVGIVEGIRSAEDGGRINVSYTVPGHDTRLTCDYDIDDLALLSTPVPTFPRVIWQGGIPNSRGERRIVQTSEDKCVPEECDCYDGMKKACWKAATWDEGVWVRQAFIDIAAGRDWFRDRHGSHQDP